MEKEPEAIGRNGYEMLGRFEPSDAKRVLKRFAQDGIRFYVDAPGEVRPIPTYFLRRHWTWIYVHPEDKDKAAEIVGGDFHT
jgi:hypothetical protein